MNWITDDLLYGYQCYNDKKKTNFSFTFDELMEQ